MLVDRTHLFILSHGQAWLMTVILSQIDVYKAQSSPPTAMQSALFHDLALLRAIVRTGAFVAQQKLLCEPAGFKLRAASLAVSGLLRRLLAAILGRRAAERSLLHVTARRGRLAERSLFVGGEAERCR
jgi:hypothetical protein